MSKAADTFKLAVAWIVVGIPLLWGVAETIRNAAKLFQ
jgi:predicted signal transduction protein with EAL and GGDEF domain